MADYEQMAQIAYLNSSPTRGELQSLVTTVQQLSTVIDYFCDRFQVTSADIQAFLDARATPPVTPPEAT